MTTAFDIEFINSTKPTVNYSAQALACATDDCINAYTQRFQQEHNLTEAMGNDIGGLIVYANNNKLAAVYDYENFWGWVV